MSFPEILEAVKLLDRDEKTRLLLELEGDVGPVLPPPLPSMNEQLASLIENGGVVQTGYQITTDAAGYKLLEQMFSEQQAGS